MSTFDLSIRDPLYGSIQIEQPELSMLKTIPVTRMRWIRQMGLACLVFPGATHTRFEHSLGTMYVADKLAHALIDKTDDDFVHRNIQAIRFAAFLHDLGHSPFSHVTEEFFRRNPRYLPENGKRYDHEKYTETVIRGNNEIKIICRKEETNPKFVSKLAAGKSRTFLDSLLSSSIDVDKIDYVARDSYFCGLPYGRIDLSFLAEGITLVENSFGDEVIAFEKKSRESLEGLLTSRLYLITNIHLHERNRAANQLLFRAMAKAYDFLLKSAAKKGLDDDIKRLILECLHFQWVDHDLIAFLEDPFQKLKFAVLEALRERFSTLRKDTLQQIAQEIPLQPGKYSRRYFSHTLLNRVLQGKVPDLRFSVSLVQLSPLTRYSLYVLDKISPYTNFLNDFKRFIQRSKFCKGKRLFLDITAPRLPEISTKILVEKENLKNLFDLSSLSRSLISETVNRLTLSIYSRQKVKRIPLELLEPLIRVFCRKAREKAINEGRYVGTDLILVLHYYLYQGRRFFEGDTRFQGLFAVLLDRLLPKPQNPYKELTEIPRHFHNIRDPKNFEDFRENSYPDFFSVGLSQDLDLLTEMGLLYTRSGPVRILETGYYPKRYERRISHYGREYVKEYLLNRYPFSKALRRRIRRILKSKSPLIQFGI